MKIKLSSTERVKKRYILLEAESREKVEKAILDFIGILGWAKASPFFIEAKNNKLVLAVDRKEINNIRAAFELSKEYIKVIKVSGTLKGLESS